MDSSGATDAMGAGSFGVRSHGNPFLILMFHKAVMRWASELIADIDGTLVCLDDGLVHPPESRSMLEPSRSRDGTSLFSRHRVRLEGRTRDKWLPRIGSC